MPGLDQSADHEINQNRLYRPADKWLGDGKLWALHTQYRNAVGAVDPGEENPDSFLTCTDSGNTTHELQAAWEPDIATTPLRTTGNEDIDRLYILSEGKHIITSIDTSACPPELVNSEYNTRDIPGRPEEPDDPGKPQEPTGISTNPGTPFMYFSFKTGEILSISKILPRVDSDDISFPEKIPGGDAIGNRYDPTTDGIDQKPLRLGDDRDRCRQL